MVLYWCCWSWLLFLCQEGKSRRRRKRKERGSRLRHFFFLHHSLIWNDFCCVVVPRNEWRIIDDDDSMGRRKEAEGIGNKVIIFLYRLHAMPSTQLWSTLSGPSERQERERERALSKNWIMNKMRIFFLSMSTQVFQRFINLIRPFFFISFHPRQTDRLQNRGGDWRWFTPLFTPKHCLLSARLFLIGLWSGLLLRSYSSSS